MENLQESISQRIKLVIDQFANGVQKHFATSVGVNPTTISEVLGKRKNMPSVGFLYKIVIAYPQLRTDWLLFGEGAMLKSGELSDKSALEDVLEEMVRPKPRAQDKILPPAGDAITEEPNPEVDWHAQLSRRFYEMRNDSAVISGNHSQLQNIIREAYDILNQGIIGNRDSDETYHMFTVIFTYDWNYPFKRNASVAWSIIKNNYIMLYPQYPFLHYFLDFASPAKKLAVLVEEEDNIWQVSDAEQQDRLLITHGWKIFRIPNKVAQTHEVDILPEHLKHVYANMLNGTLNEEIIRERANWEDELNRTTIDGFFRWLQLNYLYR